MCNKNYTDSHTHTHKTNMKRFSVLNTTFITNQQKEIEKKNK